VVSGPSFHRSHIIYIYIHVLSTTNLSAYGAHTRIKRATYKPFNNLFLPNRFPYFLLLLRLCPNFWPQFEAHILYYIIIIIIILYPPAAATVPIYTYNIYNIHCSRESCATFGIQTTVNSDRIYTNTRTRFGDKNRRHGWTRVSYSMYHRGWCWGGRGWGVGEIFCETKDVEFIPADKNTYK